MLYLPPERPLCHQVSRQAKKLVAVSATSTSTTDKKTEEELERVPYIRYPVIFKDQDQIEALLDSGSEVNAMSQDFA